MSEVNEESLVPETSKNSGQGKGQQLANKAANKAADKGKQLLKKTAKKGAAKGKLAAAAGPVIFWATVVIVAIIVLIGIIMFFATMPGMVMEKLKQLFKDLGNYFAAFFGADTTKQVDDKQIYETLDYLEDMGYDLKGYGFLTNYYNGLDDDKVKKTLSGDDLKNAKYDSKIGVIRDADNKVILAESDFILTYITSDNYAYTLKNSNVATQSGATSWLSQAIAALTSLITKMFSPLMDLIGASEGMMDIWGRGLIVAWYENNNNFGEKGKAVDTNNWANFDTVKIDMEKKQLILAKNGLFTGNKAMTYSLDGWTGRYGMPLEFLLSVHVATMMPDLSYDMSTRFNTNVNMYLHLTKGDIKAYIKKGNSYVDVSELNKLPNIESKIVWCVEQGLVDATDAIVWYDPDVYQYDWTCSPFNMTVYRNKGWTGKLYDKNDNEYTDEEKDSIPGSTIFMRKIGKGDAGYEIDGLEQDGYEMCYSFVIDELDGYKLKSEVESIISAIDGVPKENYETYTPYIADVRNHWYRDVYFIYNKNLEDNKAKFTKTDYDYEILYKERWTLYEVYSASDGEDYEDLYGENKLYLIDDEGEYVESNPPTNDKVVIDPAGTGYYIYVGTSEEAKNDEITVSKKAASYGINDEDTLEDLGWSKLKTNSNIWSAYELKNKKYSSGKVRAYTDEQLEDDDSGNPYKELVYSEFIASETIEQTGEGIRTETNALIKKMFLKNTYFRYDGTAKTAEVITALRNKLLTELKSEYGLSGDQTGIKYGALNEYYRYYFNGNDKPKVTDVTDRHYTSSALGITESDDEEKEYYVRDYSGQVSLNQDSLNAFTMLENIHTLDADYIYRDFKELIVELGYFEREELTDEVPRLLEWLVPDVACKGYPNRSIDKRENEYGSMIHSTGDISVNKQYEINELLKALESVDDETPEDAEFDAEEKEVLNIADPLGSNSSGKSATDLFDMTKQPVVKVEASGQEIMEKAKDIFEGMINAPDGIRFEYCVGHRKENCTDPSCTCGHCNHVTGDGRGCGYKNTFQEAIDSPKLRNVCCAVFVGWVLRDLGVDIDTAMEAMGNTRAWRGAASISRLCVEYLGAEVITEYDELQPGDIMGYVNEGGLGHVDILGEQKGENFTIYGCGVVPDLGGTNKNPDMTRSRFDSYEICFGMRFNGESGYVGYRGNEAVVSPVTGILLEYGTYAPDESTGKDIDSITTEAYRVNVDLKYGPLVSTSGDDEDNSGNKLNFKSEIVSDKVGYAKILVLDNENYLKLEQSVDNRWNLNSSTSHHSLLNKNGTFKEELVDDSTSLADDKLNSKDESIKWPEIDQTVYAYKEFAERYNAGGISGYIVLIDGFICEKPDEDLEDVTEKLPYQDLSEEERNQYRFTMDDDPNKISFRSVTENNFTEDDVQLESAYIKDKDNKLASTAATNKSKAENEVRDTASTTMFTKYEDEELIFIKEGTIIGRTMTDKELLEADYLRNNSMGSYEDIRESEDENKVIGNYLRIIMRDLDTTPVEDVEDYMKIKNLGKRTYADKIEVTEDEVRFIAGVCCAANTPAHNEGTSKDFEQAIAACAWAFRNRYEKTAEGLCRPWAFNNGGNPHDPDFLDRIRVIYFACSQDFGTNKASAAEVNNVTGETPVSYTVDVTGITYWANGPWEESIEIVQSVFDGTYEPIIKDYDSWKSSGTTDPAEFHATPIDEVIQMPAGLGNKFFCYDPVYLERYR